MVTHAKKGDSKPRCRRKRSGGGAPSGGGETLDGARGSGYPGSSGSRERQLFEALTGGQATLHPSDLRAALRHAGIRLDDPRVEQSVRALDELDAASKAAPREIDFETFVRVVQPNVLMIDKALKRELVIPDFGAFGDEIQGIFESVRQMRGGKVADYIPQLARVDGEQFGVAVTTIDGQRLALGDAAKPFSLQSSCKPFAYALALEAWGEEVVHRHIGTEPSGQSFNELTLNQEGRPHNPMINAGAIMSSSLIRPEAEMADRFDYVLEMWERLAGGARPTFSNSIYLSERRTADRNFALGYFMRENGAFPEGTDLLETLEFYFQMCSLELTAESFSVVAATLANGGVCPITGYRVLAPDTVQKVLSLMYSSGMYDYSGEWAFRIGLPAKSGVSGVIMIVVPNVLGLVVWSPPLDAHGNSVRGIAFARQLVSTFNFHNYDNLVGGVHGKIDPRLAPHQAKRNLLVDLCWAASEGDVDGIRRLLVQGVDLEEADYDGRTALHLAASEGRAEVVELFVQRGIELGPVDRWGNTPLDDARRGGHEKVVALLTPSAAQAA
ncbi:MAG: glutaminase A [Acidobacteriota bacterium]|nr:glutaminase A [Acidobacteriota bacterium]